MRKLLSAIAVTALCVVGSTAQASAQATTNMTVPLDGLLVFIPCANDGLGELVPLEGSLHVLFTFTENANGFSGTYHFQPQGASGVGMSTGDRYRATGVTRGTFTAHRGGGSTSTDVNNFRIIGPGPGNNLLVHGVLHTTVNANGELTATVSRGTADCK